MSELLTQPEKNRLEHRFWRGLGLAAGSMLGWFALPGNTIAHSGPPPGPDTIWSTWNVDPIILLVLGVGLWGFLRGTRLIWERAGVDRGIRHWQLVAGLAGFLALFVALISPLDPFGGALFSAHMVQHMVLMSIAAPLLVLARTGVAWLWALPEDWRQRIPGLWRSSSGARDMVSLLMRPAPVLIIYTILLWAWHAPGLYEFALRSEFVHSLEHLSMFAAAMLFWWFIFQPGRQGGVDHGVRLLVLFVAGLQGTLLGALITFSSTPWYETYAATTTLWGLTPLEDQQLAGALMLMPGGLVYLVAGLWLFAGWFRAVERSVERAEQHDYSLAHTNRRGRGIEESA